MAGNRKEEVCFSSLFKTEKQFSEKTHTSRTQQPFVCSCFFAATSSSSFSSTMPKTQDLSKDQQQRVSPTWRSKRSFLRMVNKTRGYSSEDEASQQAPSPVNLAEMFSADDLFFYTSTTYEFKAYLKQQQNALKESAVSKFTTPPKRPHRPQPMAPRSKSTGTRFPGNRVLFN